MTAKSSTASATAPQPGSERLITVASGKGGVGKTWLAITLAHALARAGRRTLLFDGDIGLANIDIQLGLMVERDLGSVAAGRISLAQAISNFAGGGFDVIAGKSGSGALGMLSTERLAELRHDLVSLANDYDRVVLDLGAGIDSAVRTMAGGDGTILVVITDEPTAITDAYAFIKVTAMRHPGIDLRIVVNMASTAAEGRRTFDALKKACESFLKISPPLAAIVRRDNKVRDTIRHQKPILTRHPNSNAAEDIESLARGLVAGP